MKYNEKLHHIYFTSSTFWNYPSVHEEEDDLGQKECEVHLKNERGYESVISK